MDNPENVARALNKPQRQALRRISRAQTIKRSMAMDPTVKSFYTLDVPAPHPDMNIVEYCDWEAEARSARPQLTEFGAEVLKALDGVADPAATTNFYN